MISGINNYFSNTDGADDSQTTNSTTNSTTNNKNLFNLPEASQDSYVFISAAAVPNEEVKEALNDRTFNMNRNRAFIKQSFLNRYKSIKNFLMMQKQSLPKLMALCGKIDISLNSARANMDTALNNDEAEAMAFKNCRTVEDLDSKAKKIEAKLIVACEEFKIKTDIAETFMSMLHDINEIVEKNPAAAQKIQDSIGEILDSVENVSMVNIDFSNVEDGKEFIEQSLEKMNNFFNGEIKEKIEEIKERIDEELGRKEKEDSLELNKFAQNQIRKQKSF